MTEKPTPSEVGRPLRVAKEKIEPQAAFEIVAGYCFGREALGTKAPPDEAVGPPLSSRQVGAFAYRTYDCIAPGPTDTLDPIDVLVANGLNARMPASATGAVLSVADEISAVLKEIHPSETFWDLPRDHILSAPDEGSGPAWHLWRAWTILMSIHGIDIATTHKILHHKRPKFFPLIDNQTKKKLAPHSWLIIYENLKDNPSGWQQLETDIATEARNRSHVALTRLRLHDILLWTHVTGRATTAQRLGQHLSPVETSAGGPAPTGGNAAMRSRGFKPSDSWALHL